MSTALDKPDPERPSGLLQDTEGRDMLAFHSDRTRHNAGCCCSGNPAPRAVAICRYRFSLSQQLTLTLLVLFGILAAALGYSQPLSTPTRAYDRFDQELDMDHNGIEDVLDSWLLGMSNWEDLRLLARPTGEPQKTGDEGESFDGVTPAGGPWQAGHLRLICLGSRAEDLAGATTAGQEIGSIDIIHDLEAFGGVTVLSGDDPGIRAFLQTAPRSRIMVDRDGTPALVESRIMAGQPQAFAGQWPLGQDWSATVAILDSGCDTAHNDLGDITQDNQDGPPPYVGDATDWFDAASGWPLTLAYKVMGWHDVTNDFPLAVGPWDYHHHGTALASVVAGRGVVDSRYRGMAPNGRLTVVKFYDFDDVWHSWAGDFLAACAWTLEHREIYRIRTVLIAVNWDVDALISDAMNAFVGAGILPVVAMGNDGPDSLGPGYPAALPSVLTVGSMDRSGAVSWHSGRGLPGQDKPDILAPGGGQSFDSYIIAADNEPTDEYSGRQGTSIAAAHVAGAAYLLQEAFRVKGYPAASTSEDVFDQIALFKASASPIDFAESSTGESQIALPPTGMPLGSRGWGGLRVDAAVDAFSRTLIPGTGLTDTLSSGMSLPVVACKLTLGAGIRYQVEAVADPGLDVSLTIVNPRWLDSANTVDLVQRYDANGSGSSEIAYVTGEYDGWFFAVVKRVSGEGQVVLHLTEADDFATTSRLLPLPGVSHSAPGMANGLNENEALVVFTSHVEIDGGARAIGVLDTEGQWYSQWPIFVFPGLSAQGSLSRPLAWDLDGSPGDEIVIASDFGTMYFCDLSGNFVQEHLAFNVPLTNPVGLVSAIGDKLVATVDRLGVVRAWSWGPTLEMEISLPYSNPLAPAVGQILAGGGQEMVVSFSQGQMVLLDAEGSVQEGWPVDLGAELQSAPVLLDMDGDGAHEIIQTQFDAANGILQFHVFNGMGEYFSGSSVIVPTPHGGPWIAVSNPSVAGRYGVGNLRVVVTGVADNGMAGVQKKWNLVTAGIDYQHTVVLNMMDSLEICATTSEGILTLDHAMLPAPLTNDISIGGGGDPISLIALDWVEDLYGLTALPGNFWGRVSESFEESRLVSRRSLEGVAGGDFPVTISAAQAPLAPGLQLELTIVNDQLLMMVWPLNSMSAPVWLHERGDKLNSGAYPLQADMVPVADAAAWPGKLTVFPNPGGGDFQFSWEGEKAESALQLNIYDLHGRLVRSLVSELTTGSMGWDGCDNNGRTLSAGVYLAVGKSGLRTSVTRVVLMR